MIVIFEIVSSPSFSIMDLISVKKKKTLKFEHDIVLFTLAYHPVYKHKVINKNKLRAFSSAFVPTLLV